MKKKDGIFLLVLIMILLLANVALIISAVSNCWLERRPRMMSSGGVYLDGGNDHPAKINQLFCYSFSFLNVLQIWKRWGFSFGFFLRRQWRRQRRRQRRRRGGPAFNTLPNC